jgi:hypothetical protein
LFRNCWMPGMVVHVCSPSTWQAEIGGLWGWDLSQEGKTKLLEISRILITDWVF